VRKNAALLFTFLLVLSISNGFANVAAIHADGLPQETAVLAALDDAKELEPYSHSWTMNWKFPIAKEDVATRLGKDIGFLSFALKNHPENTELLLLTGLVARYAYNLDVNGSYDIALDVLSRSQKLVPSDVRAPWFRATLLCQTTQPDSGAKEFLSIEDGHPWDQLPAAFWDDYMECASVTSMPAHVLRAAQHFDKLHAATSDMRNFLANGAQKSFDAFDQKKKYEPKDVWLGANADKDTAFTSTSCGLRLRAHGDWTVNQIGLEKGTCIALFSTGPYKATKHTLSPSILVLVRQPKENETLLDFTKNYSKGLFELFTPPRCPAADCMALWGVQAGMYGKDGDGHGRIVVFERDQPEFPGLIFETPLEIPKSDSGEGAKYYRPSQIQQRMPGKPYYLVMLDTAASIENLAMKDFEFFLQNLSVE